MWYGLQTRSNKAAYTYRTGWYAEMPKHVSIVDAQGKSITNVTFRL
jgi:hypothetical protein